MSSDKNQKGVRVTALVWSESPARIKGRIDMRTPRIALKPDLPIHLATTLTEQEINVHTGRIARVELFRLITPGQERYSGAVLYDFQNTSLLYVPHAHLGMDTPNTALTRKIFRKLGISDGVFIRADRMVKANPLQYGLVVTPRY